MIFLVRLDGQQRTYSSSIEPGKETVTLVVSRMVIFGFEVARRLVGACIGNKEAFRVRKLDQRSNDRKQDALTISSKGSEPILVELGGDQSCQGAGTSADNG